MNLTEYRKKLDQIDDKLLQLFIQRMEITEAIAVYKKENGIPVLDNQREKEKLLSIREHSPNDFKEYAADLFSKIMELSRGCQNRILNDSAESPDENRK